ncbi:MAG: TetR/AcrR family transcriptional regulator [Streptococcaceae bacterium]|nr:TetR/AcrR family transcriptional regulator [Streptococcaceae bacterium]
MVIGTRQRINNAFLKLASKYPDHYRVTLAEIADEAHISRQAIYRKHYSSVEEIIDEIHKSLADEIEQILAEYSPEETPPLVVISKSLLPTTYKNRETLHILSTSYIDPSWASFTDECYKKWFSPYLKPLLKPSGVSSDFMLRVIFKEIRAFLASWMTEKVPQPPEVFEKTFIRLMSSSITDLLESPQKDAS